MAKNKKKPPRRASRQVNLALIAFLSFVALVPLLGLYGLDKGYSPDLHMGSLLQIGVLLFFGYFVFKHPVQIIKSPLVICIVLLYVWASLSLLWSINRYEGSLKLLDWGAALIGFFIVTILYRKNIPSITLMLSILFASGAVAGIVSVLQVWVGFSFIPQAAVPGSFFSNKNMAAQYMLLTIPLGWYLMLKLDKYWSWLSAVCIGTMCAAVLYSTARAAWISLIAQIVIFGIWLIYELLAKQKNWLADKRWISILIVCLTFSAMFFVDEDGINTNAFNQYSEEVASIGSSISSEQNVRIAIWANSLEMIKDNWFKGIGLGNWTVEYPVYHQRVIIDRQMSIEVKHDNAHNDYIEIFAELGIIGFALFLTIMYFTGFYSFRLLCTNREVSISGDNRLFCSVIFLALSGVGIDAIFSFPLQQPVPVFWCFMLIAFIFSIYRNHFETQANINHWQPNAQLSKCLSAIAIAGALALIVMHYYWYQSEIYKRLAIIASQTGKFDAVITNAEKAYNLKPFHAELLHAIGVGIREQGHPEQAVDYMERALEHYPHTLTYLTNMVDTYIRVKDFPKARKTLKHLITIKSDDFMTQRLYGLILINEFHDYKTGIAHLRKAIELEPNHSMAENLRQRIAKYQSLIQNQQ